MSTRLMSVAVWSLCVVVSACGAPSESAGEVTDGDVDSWPVGDAMASDTTAGVDVPTLDDTETVASEVPADVDLPSADDTETVASETSADAPAEVEPTEDTVTTPPDDPASEDTGSVDDDEILASEPDIASVSDVPSDLGPEAPEVGELPPVCEPNCAGKTCGPDGCGGSCGACDGDPGCGTFTGCVDGSCAWEPGPCDDGDLCTMDTCVQGVGCVTDGVEPGPCEWPGQWAHYTGNPVLHPAAASQAQGADNIYAPDVLWYEGQWWMWYGGQGSDGHDAVFLAWSDDLVGWSRHGGASPIPVVDHGGSNHVNDPSVVHVGGTFYMYYTEAPTAEDDEVHLATSTDGVSWTKHGAVLDVGPADSWEPDRVGRPSVLYEEGEFRMWYDGQVFGVARHVGYATSQDGFTWTKHPANPVVLHEGAIDVERVGDWYVMLAESGQGTRLYVGTDPVTWQFVGQLFGLSGEAYDVYGQVTPFLLTEGGAAKAILYGGASDACWCKNRIGIAFPTDGSCVPSCAGKTCGGDGCGGSCGGCPDGQVCTAGDCAEGSGDLDCADCLAGFESCDAACQNAGKASGYCAVPGSTDPASCCACEDGETEGGCEGCLVGYDTCTAACQGAGMSGGTCAVPGSQDPAACCACF